MKRWPDLASWRGPSPNRTDGGMNRHDGQVTHIAVGWYEGTISWQRNPHANVSSHFVVGREWGECAQMVDLDDAARTQSDGNGEWISVENEGFNVGHELYRPGWERLSLWQVECNARLFARGHLEFGWPLQTTSHPSRRGLGYHSMGAENGFNWGHRYCPGEPIKAQQPLVVQRAKEIIIESGGMPVEGMFGLCTYGDKDSAAVRDLQHALVYVFGLDLGDYGDKGDGVDWHFGSKTAAALAQIASGDGRTFGIDERTELISAWIRHIGGTSQIDVDEVVKQVIARLPKTVSVEW